MLSGRATTKDLSVALLSHPSSPLQVRVESPPRAIGFVAGIKMQDDAGDVPPIGTISVGIKETHVGDQVLVVIWRQDRVGRCGIGDVGVERRSLHGRSGKVWTEHSALGSLQFDDMAKKPHSRRASGASRL